VRIVVAAAAQREAPHEVNDAATHATQSYLEMLGILPLVTLAPKGEQKTQQRLAAGFLRQSSVR
jgi:hypothetical protein